MSSHERTRSEPRKNANAEAPAQPADARVPERGAFEDVNVTGFDPSADAVGAAPADFEFVAAGTPARPTMQTTAQDESASRDEIVNRDSADVDHWTPGPNIVPEGERSER